jgi:hypothetical protein
MKTGSIESKLAVLATLPSDAGKQRSRNGPGIQGKQAKPQRNQARPGAAIGWSVPQSGILCVTLSNLHKL